MSATHRSPFVRRVLALAGAFDGAVTAARAVEAGRRPPEAALRRLGIDPAGFEGTGLR